MPCPRIRVVLGLLSWLVLSCVRVPPATPPVQRVALRYHVTYVRVPEHALEVEVVLMPGAPRYFRFTQPGGVDVVSAYREEGTRLDVEVVDGGVRVPSGVRILRYRYALEARIRGRGPDLHSGLGEGDAWHVAGRAYLLRPHEVSPGLRAELSVSEAEALLPWSPDARGVYHLRGEDLVDSGFHGFGGRRCQVVLVDAVIDVALLGHFTHLSDARVCGWLEQAASEVRTVRRAFPHPRITVRVIPVRGRDAPLFGMVLWSSPPSISLLLGEASTEASLTRDWVALHEMLHLTHPALLPRVSWLSEGLATYFTELARARSGRQSAQRAWEELVDGFARGRRSARGRTMEQVVASSDFSQGTYWSGALFALHLDVEIRRATGNTRHLEDVLELLAERGTTSTLGAFGVAVDSVAGEPVFDALLARHLSRPAFVEMEGLLEALGVTVGVAGVSLVEARDSTLRDALDGPRTSGISR
ncbi:hypothetical protein LZ198_36690 [Myxococcus sp. K15C18031901]|uniref:hypothetical protein n=1 Tax=Myxococcus dinghuensis TaxID=2906761 RepID=UPI0020A70455|nr:hypothetical protein [Myxococcus dinghuensis]MCP3104416.1 hypothetical protein [Myxococcus dinghuensis]